VSGGTSANCRVRRPAGVARWGTRHRPAAQSCCKDPLGDGHDRHGSSGDERPHPLPAANLSAVDVTIIEFAAHTAYLEPLTGTGFLVLPSADDDVAAPAQPFVEVAWSLQSEEFCFDQLGWCLLDDENGEVEIAGQSTDGRLVVCIYGHDSIIDEPGLKEIQTALVALRIAADIPPDS
jgi:hypothetical protein